MNLWHFLFIIFLYIVLIDSGKIRPNFDEIFGDGWDKKENEEKVIKMEQNERNEQNENTESDQMGEEMGNDQNLSKSDQNINDQQKREIVKKFDAIKEKLREKEKYQNKNQSKMNDFMNFKSLYGHGKQKEFAKELGISHDTFWKWKKELFPKYNKTRFSNEEKLERMKHYFEIKERNPKMSDEIIAKELEIGINTLKRWKKEF